MRRRAPGDLPFRPARAPARTRTTRPRRSRRRRAAGSSGGGTLRQRYACGRRRASVRRMKSERCTGRPRIRPPHADSALGDGELLEVGRRDHPADAGRACRRASGVGDTHDGLIPGRRGLRRRADGAAGRPERHVVPGVQSDSPGTVVFASGVQVVVLARPSESCDVLPSTPAK